MNFNANVTTFLARFAGLRGADRVEDPSRAMAAALTGPANLSLAIGIVVRSGVGSQDHTVLIGGREYNCVCLQSACGMGTGAAITAMPPEGTPVFVAKLDANSSIGFILGVVPDSYPGLRRDVPPRNPRLGLESGACVGDDDAFKQPLVTTTIPVIPSCAGRPLDAHPGDWQVGDALYGTGLKISGPVAAMWASDRAGVRASAIDDTLRLDSETFRHVHAGGEVQTFNDGGFISATYEFSPYQPERLGLAGAGTSLFKKAGDVWCKLTGFKALWESTVARARARSRIRVFVGHLGGLFRACILAPKADGDVATAEDKTPDQGLLDVHAGADGRVTMRSAAGFSFQRVDRIAVPRRRRFPWDPKGDDASALGYADPKGPFQFSDPRSRALELRDAEAWRAGVGLANMGQLKKDYAVPNESDLETPADVYDEIAQRSSEFQANEGCRSYFNLEPDGSIILRGSFGEEILLSQGYITISAPKGIRVASGSNVETLAGHDLILKAKDSVDVTATKQDVRIKAENNLHAVAASEDRGNILLESRAKGDASAAETGEAFTNAGVVIRAAASRIYSHARSVHAHADEEIKLESDASLLVAADQLKVEGSSEVELVRGGKGASFTDADDNVEPLQWKGDGSKTSTKERNAPYTPELREKAKFSYRVDADYGDVAVTMQPAWAFMLAHGEDLGDDISLSTWAEADIDGEYPWPGKSAYTKGTAYVKLTSEKNLTSGGGVVAAKSWSELTETSGGLSKPLPFSKYEVVTK